MRISEEPLQHINDDCSIASVTQHGLPDMQCKAVQHCGKANACISDKDDAVVKKLQKTKYSKLSRIMTSVLTNDLLTKYGVTIQKERHIANGADSATADKVRRERVTLCEGLNETVGSLSEDAILNLKIRIQEPDPSNTECLLLARGIRSCCHIVL